MSGTLRGEIWRLSLAVAHSDISITLEKKKFFVKNISKLVL